MGLFIHDECHWTSSQKIYDFLQYFKTNINCKLIGFSATPTRIIKDHQIKSYSIYGNQEEFNVIYQRSFMDAILDKDIAEINFKFFKINLQHVDKIKENNNDSTQNIRYIEQYQLNNIGMNKLLIYINEHVKKSVYGKGIIWFIDIESLKKFHKYYKSHLIKYSELVNFKFIETNSKCDDRDAINKFINIKRNCILLAVDQATEGFDDPRIDFGIRAYLAKSISPILEIQRMGRMMRIYNKKKSSTYITIENLEIEEFKDDWIKRMSNFTKYIQEFNNKSFFYNGIDYTIDQIIIKFMDLEQIECINKQETKELTLSNIINILNEHNFKNDKINWEEQYNIIAKKDVRLSKISMNDLRNNYFDKKNWYKIMKIDKQYYTFEELVKYFYEKNILK
jgi:superfamily II DNA or RNA helicase